jgi:hypothetical protein
MINQGIRFLSRIFHENGAFPNNEKLPLIILQSPINDAEIEVELFEDLFRKNNWPAAWRNGLYDFHHYHSRAHEVLARLSLFEPPNYYKCLIFRDRPQKVGTTESSSTERLQRQFEEVAVWAELI